MEEEDTLINVQEVVNRHRPASLTFSIWFGCCFITICFAVAGILLIDYLFSKKKWL
jgi:hypothetical protein